MKSIPIVLLGLALIVSGCASDRQKAVHNADWDSRVGSYTYDQALAELGNPRMTAESGEGTTAEWIVRRSSNVSFGVGMGAGSYGSHSGAGVGVGSSVAPPPHGDYLQLKFGKDGKLKEWSKVKY